jgi:hypothetical protein
MIIFFFIYIFFELPVMLALESCSYWDAMMYFEAKVESGRFSTDKYFGSVTY